MAASTAGVDSDFDDEDYAPSDRRGMFTARHRARCHATLLQQPQPVSFDAVEVKADVYPPPKVPARAKEASIVQPGSTIEPTVTVTFSLSDARDPRWARRVHDIIRLFEEDLIQSEEQPARPVSPAPPAEPERAVIPDESTTQTPSISLAMPAARVKFVRASASALASRQVQFETSSKDASDLPGKPSLHRSSKGIPFCVAGAPAQPLRGIQDIPEEQRSHLFTRDPLAASYFNEEQYMFYYPTGAGA